MAPSPDEAERLNVVALISGGKDSFFSVLHCLANGHRVVALANLYPPAAGGDSKGEVTAILPGQHITTTEDGEGEEGEEDLNSFMYQTVGHQVIPLYAEATGLPLYRRAITGASGGGRDYRAGGEGDETESMTHLLRAVMEAHPEVNAVSAGALLSNYQRTRVESVAVRLGLTPLAYLWKFPLLPLAGELVSATPGHERLGLTADLEDEAVDDCFVLDDMAEAGLEARIIKVASGGLDETHLWTNVSSEEGKVRIFKALSRFGGVLRGRGAVLGEGGEYETLVVDGPSALFQKKIVIEEEDRVVVREGGGTAWLRFRKARLEDKPANDGPTFTFRGPPDSQYVGGLIRMPDNRSARFNGVDYILSEREIDTIPDKLLPGKDEVHPLSSGAQGKARLNPQLWCVVGDMQSPSSIETETASLMKKVQDLLQQASLPTSFIISTVVVLRHMADFPAINKIYGSLFTRPKPPSRVTISSGAGLPPNRNIAVYLSIYPNLVEGERQGLHVQSRSYWAPANIGPYSQAITVPMFPSSPATQDSTGPPCRLVYVAGQIGLIPETMELDGKRASRNLMFPGGTNRPGMGAFLAQTAMALQHLWRIGVEVDVGWWSSAVAYIPRTYIVPFAKKRLLTMKEKALLAGEAWVLTHMWDPKKPNEYLDFDLTEEERKNKETKEEEDEGPDLWDRTHNPAFMSFSGENEENTLPKDLPDWAMTVPGDKICPPVFTAEVQGLPRDAEIEWHAHAGFTGLAEGCLRVTTAQSEVLQVWHTVVDMGEEGVLMHSVLQVRWTPETVKLPLSTVVGELNTTFLARVAAVAGLDAAQSLGEVAPTHVYANIDVVDVEAGDVGRDGCPVVPCFSLWDWRADELTAVAVYQTVLEREHKDEDETMKTD
jgi:diphthine-ammonia ligase